MTVGDALLMIAQAVAVYAAVGMAVGALFLLWVTGAAKVPRSSKETPSETFGILVAFGVLFGITSTAWPATVVLSVFLLVRGALRAGVRFLRWVSHGVLACMGTVWDWKEDRSAARDRR